MWILIICKSGAYVTTSSGLVMMQEVKSGSSLGAGNDTALHFGLGTDTIDSIEILWTDGTRQMFETVSTNQEMHIHYGGQLYIPTLITSE